ncbi:MAG TPA: SUMF1/EgtB/PvdO family nonheme iron enzyme [Candidatus Eremiobacteraeota bacterium]|nr:MAG: Serine/threonine-protein kinase pkn1 [bacterium ADurb.Bin363]HPZ08289.1 SUMF1/EgtB/PvdO family nonheme iron enzyme [Candidatus Eremiobacteraeota bacterium]
MIKYCSSCGAQNIAEGKFCSTCGVSMEDIPATCSLAMGTLLDNRYEIKKLIKTGGMGAIYQAIDKRFNNKCAVKEMALRESQGDSAYLTHRFQEEAKLLRTLHHPNLPRVIDYFIEKGTYYIIMDLIEGQDLDEIVHKYGNPGLPEEKVIKWSIEVLDVLSYLHKHNPPIIYRDLKPANIMIQTKNNQIMLIDFGIARSIMPENINTMTSVGTPHYSSPEHFEGKACPQSDLFSLGATMHHILTGKIPTPCMFKPVRYLNPDVSLEMEIILERALALEIPDRYQSTEEMKQDLTELMIKSKKTSTLWVPDKDREESTTSKSAPHEFATRKKEESAVTRKKEESAVISKKEKPPVLGTELLRKLQALPDMLQAFMKRESRENISKPAEGGKETKTFPEKRFNSPFIDEKILVPSITNEKDESTMLLITGGEYWIGNDDNSPNAVELEKPKHMVTLKPYYIDKYQVTNRQYCKFMNRKRMEGAEEQWIYISDGECKITKMGGRYRVEAGYEEHPVVCITWYGARAYAEWAEKRLPTEAEWEVAARGTERREYPWGNEWHPKKCANRCFGGCSILMPVGSFPQGVSPFNIEDMAGNVWEWCEDWLNAYPGSELQNENFGTEYKIVRGGAWFLDNPLHFRTSFRRWYKPTFRYYFLGFRCCKDPM